MRYAFMVEFTSDDDDEQAKAVKRLVKAVMEGLADTSMIEKVTLGPVARKI